MKKKKKGQSAEEHISTLSQYYDFDEETDSFVLPIKREKASDILDLDVKDPKKHPRFKREEMDALSETLSGLPSGTKADVRYEIGDYEGRDPESLMHAFTSAVHLVFSRRQMRHKRSGILAMILVLAGALILGLYVFGKLNGWFGLGEGNLGYEFVTEMLDIVAWVFVWEAVAVIFLGGDYLFSEHYIFSKFSSVGFYDGSGKKQLAGGDANSSLKKEIKAVRWTEVGRNMIIVGATAMLMYGVYLMINWISICFTMGEVEQETALYIYALAGIGVLIGLFFLFLGIGGIYLFLDRPVLRRFTTVFIIILGVFLVVYAIASAVTLGVSALSSLAFSLIIYFVYLIGFILVMALNRKKKA